VELADKALSIANKPYYRLSTPLSPCIRKTSSMEPIGSMFKSAFGWAMPGEQETPQEEHAKHRPAPLDISQGTPDTAQSRSVPF